MASDDIVRRVERTRMPDRLRLTAARLRNSTLNLGAALGAFVHRVRNGGQLPAWDTVAALSPTVSVRLILGCAAAALAICALGFALFVEWRSVTFTVASVHEERANLAPLAPAEERPERSTDGTYSRANVRYCTFQQIRLEAVGPIVDVADLGVFSAHVADWNARCAQYRYEPADKEAVDLEAAGRRALLAAEGRALMSGWRRKIATTMQDRPPPSAPLLDAGTGAPGLAEAASADPLPPLIRLGRAGSDEADRDAILPVTLPSLALLRVDGALRVQKRLNELGYVIAPADGTWGAMSRNALRRFKQANGLLLNDAFDQETAARLFSAAAVPAPPDLRVADDTTATIETAYPPPPAATMNPLNRADGQRIQRRLAELGYYTGRGEGLWGTASRTALRNFKLMNGLRDNEEWDAMTEAMLLSDGAARASEAVRSRVVVPPPPPAAVSAAAKRPTPAAAAKPGDASATGDASRPPAVVPGSSLKK